MKVLMVRMLAFGFFLLAGSLTLSAQEICDNAVDDDADGLVDFQDPDCTCSGIAVNPIDVTDKVPNPSFENMDCCPDWISQVTECLSGWVAPTTATPDYQNTCDFVMNALYSAGLYPFPSGEGVVGLLIGQNWREGIGACLNGSLEAGKQYTFQIQIAFVPVTMSQQQGYPECPDPPSYPPINFAVFGNSSCNKFNMNGTLCPPSIDPTWKSMGEAVYVPNGDWGTLSITFNPTEDVAAIIFSTACQIPTQYTTPPCSPYFFLDDISLFENDLGGDIEVDLSGNPCDDDLELSATADPPGGDFQWYFQGQAILGQTGSTLQVPAAGYQPGTYMVTYTINGECVMDSVELTWTLPQPTADTIRVCAGETAFCGGESFDMPGVYDLVFTNPQGCDSVHTCVIEHYPEIPLTIQEVDLCGPASAEVCGFTFTESGSHTVNCTSALGCDSLVELNLRILEPLADIQDPNDLPCGGVGSVVLDGTLSNSNPFIGGTTTYAWTGPAGSIQGASNGKKAEATLPGIYCLEVTHNLQGVSCMDSLCVLVGVSQGPPPKPAISGPGTICIRDTLILESMPSDTQLLAQWFIPSGLSALEQGKTHVRLSGEIPGTYPVCMSLSYPCGVSDTSCFLVQVLASDSTQVERTTCDPSLAGWDTLRLQNAFGCDSLVITHTTLRPSYVVPLTVYTCDPSQAGTDTLHLLTTAGCDSLVVTNTIHSSQYQETKPVTLCGPGVPYSDTLLVTTGPCDSLFITAYSYLDPDTTFLQASTCDPTQAGQSVTVYSNGVGCDSTVFTLTALLPSDNTLIETTTCDAGSAGTQQFLLQNRFGCDSLVTVNTLYVGLDTQFVQKTTCDPAQAGTQTEVVPGTFCDTVRVISYSLLPSSTGRDTVFSCANTGPISDTLLLTNSLGCDSLHITEFRYASLEAQAEIDDESCAGARDGRIEVLLLTGGTAPFSYRLEGGSAQSLPLFSGLAPGTYRVIVRDAAGCADTLTALSVGVGEVLTVDAGPDREASPGEIIQLSATGSATLVQVQWTATDPLACAGCLQTALGPLSVAQTVTLNGVSAAGCTATDQLEIFLRRGVRVYIPNGFSPDNDGINDIFSVFGNELVRRVRNLAIYDRWGNALYYREDLPVNDPGEGWDGRFRGKPMDPGVFVYVVEVEFTDGSVELFKGDVTLLR